MTSRREQFEAAFTEEMVSRLGEGFRTSVKLFFQEKEPDGSYSNPIAHAGWWAWEASRQAVVVDITFRTCLVPGGNPLEVIDACRAQVEAQGLKVTP